MSLEATCSTEQQAHVFYTPKGRTRPGGPLVDAQIDGPIRAALVSGDPNASVFTDPEKPTEVTYVTGDLPMETVFEVRADADLGAGVIELVDTFTLRATLPQIVAESFEGRVAIEAKPGFEGRGRK